MSLFFTQDELFHRINEGKGFWNLLIVCGFKVDNAHDFNVIRAVLQIRESRRIAVLLNIAFNVYDFLGMNDTCWIISKIGQLIRRQITFWEVLHELLFIRNVHDVFILLGNYLWIHAVICAFDRAEIYFKITWICVQDFVEIKYSIAIDLPFRWSRVHVMRNDCFVIQNMWNDHVKRLMCWVWAIWKTIWSGGELQVQWTCFRSLIVNYQVIADESRW